MVYAKNVINTGTIDVSGADANTTIKKDASGGGGAAGSVILAATSGLAGITVTANGGNGGDNTGGGGGPHGPGGGGGAGVIYSNSAINAASSATGGSHGNTSTGAYGSFSATAPGVIQVLGIASPASCLTLAVNFLAVSATGNAGKTMISWKMGSEENMLEYVVEKSVDGVSFVPLGTLLYQFPVSGTNDYQFTDFVPVANGNTYYRIRALDNSGRSFYSNIVSVRLSAAAGALAISPNPAVESASLGVVSSVNGQAEIRLLDMTGHSCWQKRYTVNAAAIR